MHRIVTIHTIRTVRAVYIVRHESLIQVIVKYNAYCMAAAALLHVKTLYLGCIIVCSSNNLSPTFEKECYQIPIFITM